MKLFTIIILIFLVFGGFLIVKYNNYKLDNPGDAVSFTKDYGKWMFGVGKSVSNVVGAVVKETWLPNNESNESNKSKQKVVVLYD